MAARVAFDPSITALVNSKPDGGATAVKASNFLSPHDDRVPVVKLAYYLGSEIPWSCENWQHVVIIGMDIAENTEFFLSLLPHSVERWLKLHASCAMIENDGYACMDTVVNGHTNSMRSCATPRSVSVKSMSPFAIFDLIDGWSSRTSCTKPAVYWKMGVGGDGLRR